MDIIITILKYTSLLIGSVSGVIGLMYDFKDKKSKLITPKGRILLWLIILSSILSIILQSLELYKEKRKEEIAESRSLEEAIKTNKMLTDIDRTLNPIKEIFVSYDIQMLLAGKEFNNYRLRLNLIIDTILSDCKKLDEKQRSKYLFKHGITQFGYQKDSLLSIGISQNSRLFPDKKKESLAYYVLKSSEVEFSFYDKEIKHISDNTKSDFNFEVSSGIPSDGFDGDHRINYDLANKTFTLTTFNLPADSKYWFKTGRIISIPDISESKLIVKLQNHISSGDASIDEKLKEVREGLKLKSVFLNMSAGTEFNLKGAAFKQINKSNEMPKFLFTFPKDLKNLLIYNPN